MTQDVHLHLNLRAHQLRAFNNRTRFNVRVWHRRAGKTFYRIAEKLVDALQTEKDDYRAYYVGPTFKQAKSVSWDYLTAFVKSLPRVEVNSAELRVDLPNGARIQLLGAEQYDSLRGLYADDVTFDETALIPTAAWSQVVSPMLADRGGGATFIGTPMGRMNLFYEQWKRAVEDGDPEWSHDLLTYRDTDVLSPKEVARMRRDMTPDEFRQELECSWNAAIRGAYYSTVIEQMQARGRITSVLPDKAIPVVAAVDLGWSDAMVVGFWQHTGTEHRCLLALAYEHTSIPDMVEQWRGLPFRVQAVILPHDAKVTDLGSGRTRQETFHSLGCATILCPNIGVHEGIEQVRALLAHAWFDRTGCATLVEALLAYRSQYDEVRRIASTKPLHDWSSHWADMVRYYAVGGGGGIGSWEQGVGGAWGAQPLGNLGVYA